MPREPILQGQVWVSPPCLPVSLLFAGLDTTPRWPASATTSVLNMETVVQISTPNVGVPLEVDWLTDITDIFYPGGLSNEDLLVLGEMLIAQDDDNVGGQYVLDLQCTTNNGNPNDCSPFPLFVSVQPEVLERPIYVKLAALYDNYKQVVHPPKNYMDMSESFSELTFDLPEPVRG